MVVRRVVWVAACVLMLAMPSVVWWHWPSRLPRPEVCSRDQLYRWMALRDLAQESPDTQASLVSRFQQLIDSGQLGNAVNVDPRYQSRVDSNRSVLQDRWFHDSVQQYAKLPADQRAAFLDRQINTIVRWRSMASDSSNAVIAIGNQLGDWLDKVEPNDRAQVADLVAAGCLRWLATHDLNKVELTARQAIVVKLSNGLELDPDVDSVDDWSNQLRPILPQDTRLLVSNGDLLLEAWFHTQARRFSSLPIETRNSFAAEQVDVVRKSPLLTIVSIARVGNTIAAENPIVIASKMMYAIDKWIQRADEGDREMLSLFKAALQHQVIRLSFPWMKLKPA